MTVPTAITFILDKALRCGVQRRQPYGAELWVRRTAEKFGVEGTPRARERPPLRADGSVKGS